MQLLCVLFLLAGVVITLSQAQTTIVTAYVDPVLGDDSNGVPGRCAQATPCQTLQVALDAIASVADADGIVEIAANSVVDGNLVGNNDLSFPIARNLTLQGPVGLSLADRPVWNGQGQHRFMTRQNVLLYVERCEFRENFAANFGGAVFITGSLAQSSFVDCTFENNLCHSEGGAVYSQSLSDGHSIEYHRCVFRGNRGGDIGDTDDVGAVRAGGGGGLILLRDSLFESNTARSSCGALRVEGSVAMLDVRNCTFRSNHAHTSGGAACLFVSGGSPNTRAEFRDCIFEDNSAGALPGAASVSSSYGGAIRAEAASFLFDGCVFRNNSLPSNTIGAGIAFCGGAIHHENNYPLTISHCLFEGNSASSGRAGALCARGSPTTVSHSIFRGNFAAEGGAIRLDRNAVGFTGHELLFESNHALVTPGVGSVLYSHASGLTTLRNVTLAGSNPSIAAAIYYYGDDGSAGLNLTNLNCTEALPSSISEADIMVETHPGSAIPALIFLNGMISLFRVRAKSSAQAARIVVSESAFVMLRSASPNVHCVVLDDAAAQLQNKGELWLDECSVGGNRDAWFENSFGGVLHVHGNTQFDTSFRGQGTSRIVLGAGGAQPGFPSGYDRLDVRGTTCELLSPTLAVPLRGGYAPLSGTRFLFVETILSDIVGAFPSVDIQTVFAFSIEKSPKQFTLLVTSDYCAPGTLGCACNTSSTSAMCEPSLTCSNGICDTSDSTAFVATSSTTVAVVTSPLLSSGGGTISGEVVSPSEESTSLSALLTMILIITVVAVSCCCIMGVGLIAMRRRRRASSRSDRNQACMVEVPENITYASPGLTPGLRDTYSPISLESPPQFKSSDGNGRVSVMHGIKDKHSLKYEEIVMQKELASGNFGSVFCAVWRDMEVAVKELKRDRQLSQVDLNEFYAESETMASLPPHKHVVGFIGYCSSPHGLVIVTEFCNLGSFDDVLVKYALSVDVKITIMTHIAKGMSHLAREQLIHKDLAARNCFVSGDAESQSSFVGKVGDFGLSRSLSSDTPNDESESELRYLSSATSGPLRWMAPESLESREYSEKTDVFMFGQTCIEALTEQKPYPEVELQDFRQSWQQYHLAAPDRVPTLNVPQGFVNLVRACLSFDSSGRPRFANIVTVLDKLPSTNCDGN